MQAPFKKKFSRGNNSLLMTKTLRKTIMIRYRLKNRFHKTRSDRLVTLQNTKKLMRKIVKKD